MEAPSKPFILFLLAGVLSVIVAVTAIGVLNFASYNNIRTIINQNHALSVVSQKSTLTGTRASAYTLAVIEEELGTIIIANHLSTGNEKVQCSVNPVKFTVSCKLVGATATSTTTAG